MRNIETHHDGYGLNETITLTADDRNESGASHHYVATIGGVEVLRVQFQKGQVKEIKSTPGVTENVLLAIVLDRMEGFNAGPYRCRENSLVATKVEEAIHWLRSRALDRFKRGVLGRNAK